MIVLMSQIGVIAVSILFFLLVILLLVGILLYAKAKLTPQGVVKLTINDKEMEIKPGSTMLTDPFEPKHIPSFCVRRVVERVECANAR
jgi:Na+-transporting NADH:ubiquinone oxidoreductase subunit F